MDMEKAVIHSGEQDNAQFWKIIATGKN